MTTSVPSLPGGCVVHTLAAFPDLTRLHATHPQRYPHLLESVAQGTPQARYDILFAFPGNTLRLEADGRLHWPGPPVTGDFLSALDQVWRGAARDVAAAESNATVPFSGGWLLYLGYELAHSIEPSIIPVPMEAHMPVAFATRFPAAIIRDHARRCTYLMCENPAASDLISIMQVDVLACAQGPEPALVDIHARLREDPPQWYLQGIQRILEYIRAGDVFQVNLSRAWHMELSQAYAPVDIYRRLRSTNPAPHAGLLTFEPARAVISSSPERLVEVRAGRVRTRPIAGTSPRSADSNQDQAWSRSLLQHPKERAEHVMLVDLERNDIGRVCMPGSVQVNEFMVLESYAHVHHIVSGIEGRLRPGVTPGQVIRAVFPGGTITGCPKVRTMQIIAELEQTERGPYTGSMGYLNHDGDMDLNILIRTLVLDRRQLRARAGGGIVADSDPQRELNETRAKAKGLLAALTLDG